MLVKIYIHFVARSANFDHLAGSNDLGRLVITHSYYLEGLIPILEKLAKKQGIKTVTPGVIGSSKGRCQSLRVKISSSINGGYKLIARRGKTVQEVFVITEVEKIDLENIIKDLTK